MKAYHLEQEHMGNDNTESRCTDTPEQSSAGTPQTFGHLSHDMEIGQVGSYYLPLSVFNEIMNKYDAMLIPLGEAIMTVHVKDRIASIMRLIPRQTAMEVADQYGLKRMFSSSDQIPTSME
jgi:hypothetical protein